MNRFFVVVCLVALAQPAASQPVAFDRLMPPLPTVAERHVADAASWATVVVAEALDTWTSWKAPDRRHAFELQGARVAATYAVVFAAKLAAHRARPCAPDCGIDNPDFSFFSGHAALAFSTLGGPRLAVGLPLAISTGGLRVAAGKHYLTDVLMGAAVGALTSRLR